MKKIFLGILAVPLIIALWGGNAGATSYYVRPDGGDSTQCDGRANAPAGSGGGCAFNHPRYALGWGCTNMGYNCANAGVMQKGDTLYIDGDDPTNNGEQAQYEIGYDDTDNNLTPGCSSSSPYDCTLGNLPAGISADQRTSIIGTGKHKPQLWGTQRVWQVLNADNDHIWLQNLEITDHAECAYNDPTGKCNYDGSYPYGQWGEDGLRIGGDDVNVTDVYVHGLGRYGIYTDNFGSATLTRVYVIGNGYGGVETGDTATISGTLTFNQPIVEWNGCIEAYPVEGGIDNPANYSQCFGQDSGGYGVGLAFGNTNRANAGNWTIIGPGSVSFNVHGDLDTLHGNGTGTVQIDKMRFEGGAGNEIKVNALNVYITNNIIIGDCGWWYGAPQSVSGGMRPGDTCRALGDSVLFDVTNGSTTEIYNNTILSNGNITLEAKDMNNSGCNASTSIHAANNIILGGYAWIDDRVWNSSGGNTLTTYLYNAGNDGDGAGTCGHLRWNEDYNIVYNTKGNNGGCAGSHDRCGTNPGFAGTIRTGKAGGGANTFYQGTSEMTSVSLKSNSPAIGSGVARLHYWNNGNDYSNMPRANPPSIGALEKNSYPQTVYNGNNINKNDNENKGIVTQVTGAKPEVIITTPVNGTNFAAGSDVTIIAAASENNGIISSVSFYYNGMNLLGTATKLPYEYTAPKVQAGRYSITAVATDINGASTASSPIVLTVKK